jgi:hypothetical protein
MHFCWDKLFCPPGCNEFALEQARMKAQYEHYERHRENKIIKGLGGALFQPMN